MKIPQSVDAGLLHNAQELVLADFTVAVLVELIDHGLKLVV